MVQGNRTPQPAVPPHVRRAAGEIASWLFSTSARLVRAAVNGIFGWLAVRVAVVPLRFRPLLLVPVVLLLHPLWVRGTSHGYPKPVWVDPDAARFRGVLTPDQAEAIILKDPFFAETKRGVLPKRVPDSDEQVRYPVFMALRAQDALRLTSDTSRNRYELLVELKPEVRARLEGPFDELQDNYILTLARRSVRWVNIDPPPNSYPTKFPGKVVARFEWWWKPMPYFYDIHLLPDNGISAFRCEAAFDRDGDYWKIVGLSCDPDTTRDLLLPTTGIRWSRSPQF